MARKFSRHRSFAQLERYTNQTSEASQTSEEHEWMIEDLFDETEVRLLISSDGES